MKNDATSLTVALAMLWSFPAFCTAVEVPMAVEGESLIVSDGESLRRVPLNEETRRQYGIAENFGKPPTAGDWEQTVRLWLAEIKTLRSSWNAQNQDPSPRPTSQPPPRAAAPAPVKPSPDNPPPFRSNYTAQQLQNEFGPHMLNKHRFTVTGTVTKIKYLSKNVYQILLDDAVAVDVTCYQKASALETDGSPKRLGKWSVGQPATLSATCLDKDQTGLISCLGPQERAPEDLPSY